MKSIYLLLILIFFESCSSDIDSQDTSIQSGQDWLIPRNEVFDGGPGKDGIPALENPNFVSVNEINYLDDDDLVLGIMHGDVVRAYPHPILDWHEIINDDVDDKSLSITYCPLTGTGIAWESVINNSKSTFGVSGLLYNTNLMPYDRATNSTWSQQRLECVNGELIGQKAKTYNMVETSWRTWKKAYPNSEVVSENTGFSRSYGFYPYGDYRINNGRILFPISNEDNRLQSKERVLGVISGPLTRAYQFNEDEGSGIELIEDIFSGESLIIVRSKAHNFIVAFKKQTNTSYTVIQNDLPNILSDNKGNIYNLFGQIIEGPSTGQKLDAPTAFIGYWFSWATFYPKIDIYE